MRGVRRSIVLEQMALEPCKRDGAQEPRRHDAIRVDVVASQRQAAAGDGSDGACRLAHAGTCSSICRTSTTSPAMAAAATIAGLMSRVRPVGLPWRPLKLRLEEDAQICRPSR